MHNSPTNLVEESATPILLKLKRLASGRQIKTKRHGLPFGP